MKTLRRYSPEVREWAVRMVFEHQHEHGSQWATIESISAKVGCTAETLRRWVRQSEIDQGERGGISTDERERTSVQGALQLLIFQFPVSAQGRFC
jgi:transposase